MCVYIYIYVISAAGSRSKGVFCSQTPVRLWLTRATAPTSTVAVRLLVSLLLLLLFLLLLLSNDWSLFVYPLRQLLAVVALPKLS